MKDLSDKIVYLTAKRDYKIFLDLWDHNRIGTFELVYICNNIRNLEITCSKTGWIRITKSRLSTSKLHNWVHTNEKFSTSRQFLARMGTLLSVILLCFTLHKCEIWMWVFFCPNQSRNLVSSSIGWAGFSQSQKILQSKIIQTLASVTVLGEFKMDMKHSNQQLHKLLRMVLKIRGNLLQYQSLTELLSVYFCVFVTLFSLDSTKVSRDCQLVPSTKKLDLRLWFLTTSFCSIDNQWFYCLVVLFFHTCYSSGFTD